MAVVELSSLVPSAAFLLPYALPLFLLSFILTFSGAFLTLDRTRSFTPTGDVIKPNTTFLTPFLHGGVGGIIAGYAFGLHLSTFLSLLIPSVSDSASLNPSSFLAVWILSAISTAVVAGRWKYVALTFAGVNGGATLALSLCVIIHPSLITRIAVVAVFVPLLTILVLLPLPRFQPIFVRLAMSSTGAFGLVVSIATMAHISAWENAWDRLWVKESISWGTAHEKGLSAGFCLFLFVGTASDWFLKSRFGENPDQKWDNYLAEYAANLPNASDRAGSFQPLTSAWHKFFSHSATRAVNPPYHDSKLAEKSLSVDSDSHLGAFQYEKTPGFLRKHGKGSNPSERKRGIKFRPLDVDELSSSDSEPESGYAKPRGLYPSSTTIHHVRPLNHTMQSGSTTPVELEDKSRPAKFKYTGDTENEHGGLLIPPKPIFQGEGPDYSDHEEDVTLKSQRSRDDPLWTPLFLRRHRDSETLATTRGSGSSNGINETSLPPPNGVPVTPSLLNALDRIAVAQGQACGKLASSKGSSTLHDHLSDPPTPGLQWDAFWKDVNAKVTNPQ